MNKLMLLLMVAGVVLLTAGTVQAVDYVDAGSGLWNDAANWTGAIPTSADWAKISNADPAHQTATIGAGVNAVTGKTHLGYTGGGTLNIIDGGSLTTFVGAQDGDLLLSKNGGDAYLNLIDGTIEVGRDFEVGQGSGVTGTLNMTGGSILVHDDLEIAQIAGSTGIVNLDAGTITLDGTYEGNAHLRMYAGGSLNFGGDGSGLLTILGADRKNAIQAYIDAGQITSVLGGAAVDFDGVDTTLYAVPEPATMVLLGLGGLLMRRKK